MSFVLLKSFPAKKTEFAQQDLAALARFVLIKEKVGGEAELTLDLTNPTRIRGLNRRFRGVDRNTDVIAFRYELSPKSKVQGPKSRLHGVSDIGHGTLDFGLSGDIAINVPQARIQAKKFHHSPKREIRLLLIHGILHLLGYTDYEPEPRRKMFKRQNALLRAWENSPKEGFRR